MIRLTRAQALRGHRARGVAFVYFALLGLPAFFFGAGLAVDFTRIIIAHRQVANVAQAAALSGAQQFTTDAATLNTSLAVAKASETYCAAQQSGALSLSSGAGSTGVRCTGMYAGAPATITVATAKDRTGAATTVDVTARYRVTGLIFTGFFGADRSLTADPVTRSATICVPGDVTGPTNGFCAHPRTG